MGNPVHLRHCVQVVNKDKNNNNPCLLLCFHIVIQQWSSVTDIYYIFVSDNSGEVRFKCAVCLQSVTDIYCMFVSDSSGEVRFKCVVCLQSVTDIYCIFVSDSSGEVNLSQTSIVYLFQTVQGRSGSNVLFVYDQHLYIIQLHRCLCKKMNGIF